MALRVIPETATAAMAAEVSGDLLYSVKELPTSLGVALEARRQRPRPLIADIDDWELGFRLESIQAMVRSRFRDETRWVARMLLDVHQPHSLWRAAGPGGWPRAPMPSRSPRPGWPSASAAP